VVKKLVVWMLCATVVLCGGAFGATLSGTVVGVADGDTVTVLDDERVQHRVRLLGIDAPEKAQDFGNRSKQSLSGLVFGRKVVVVYAKEDQYGRVLGKVIVDGVDANLEQVRGGLAWHYKQFEREQSPKDRELYAAAEHEARSKPIGLWGLKNPTPPWEYRHKGGSRGGDVYQGGRTLELWGR
jgi:endonuclease YncB( thermonuclease family)